MPRNRFMITLAALSLLVVACGSPAGDTTSTEANGTTVSSTMPPETSTSGPSTTSTTAPPTTPTTTTTTMATTTTTLAPPTEAMAEADLPGTRFDLAPVTGASLAVVGVAHDDVLNVRRAPGMNYDIVSTLAPHSNDFVATGRARMLTQSIWFEGVTVDGLFGWVASQFTARMGPTDDITWLIVEELGEIPVAVTMEELGLVAANAVASTDPQSDIVISAAATIGDLGEITYDVVGLGDDSVWALRLHVFGEPDGLGNFSLKAVESTDMCVPVRGASPEGPCA